MENHIENISDLERRITVSIPAKEVDGKTTEKLNQVCKKAKLPGFRPGKIPFSIAKRRFGNGTRQEVISDLINSTYKEILDKNELNPAGFPKIEIEETDFNQPAKYTATFEIYPKVDLKDLKGEKIEKGVTDINQKDVDKVVYDLRKRHATWTEVARKSKNGDQLIIDFEGKINGEIFEGGSAKDFKFELGSNMMLEDMETPLIGKQAGDEVNLSLEFPKDYHGVSVAGKKAEFHVIVHKVLESKLAELGSDLFKKIGISTEKEEDFLKEVRSNMEKRLEHASSMKLKSEIVDRLLSLNPLKLPKVLVENEINRAKQRFGQERGIDSNKLPDSLKKRFEEEAKRAVHTSLLLSEISKKEKIKPDLQRVKLKISDIANFGIGRSDF